MKKLLVIIGLFNFSSLVAQESVDNQFNTWITLNGDHKLGEKIDLHTLCSFRRNDFLKNWQQSLVRVGVGYKLTGKIKAQVGYDWLLTFPYGRQPIAQTTNEHRIWFHLNSKFKEGRFYFKQRFRFENRTIEQFDDDGNYTQYRWAFRIRYKLGIDIPLNNSELIDNTIFASLSDEIFMNIKNPSKYFDQNWFFAGLGWKFNKNNRIKIGYMNQFLPKSDHLNIEINHTLNLSYQHNFN